MHEIEIRRAQPADLEALLALYVQLSPSNAATTLPAAAAAFAYILENTSTSLLVATDGNEVVGTVTLVVVPNLTHGAVPWAQIENMVVNERVRGGGVGRLLIEECMRLAAEAGCYKVQLQSGNERREPPYDAHGFYAHLGFEPSSVGFRRYFR